MVTVDGIDVDLTAETFEDYDVLEAIADVNGHTGDPVAQLADVVRLFRLVFGADYDRIKRELREEHDGKLTADDMTKFFNDVAVAVDAKN